MRPARTGVRESAGTLVFSEKFSCLNCGTSMPELEPRIFSFNSPHGACPRCTGLGSQMEIDPDLVVDPSLTINEGAILPWSSGADYYEQLGAGDRRQVRDRPRHALGGPVRGGPGPVPLRRRGRARLRLLPQPDGPPALLHGAARGRRPEPRAPLPRDRLGVLARADRGVHVGPARARSATARGCGRRASRSRSAGSASTSSRASRRARRSTFLDELELSDSERQIAARILKEIVERLRFLDSVGVGYLTLERAAATLSGGEAQRIRLATQIGSSLVGVLYILDEPSIGLHQRDNHKLLDMLARLRDLGNTVIVVEHDEGTMRAADHIVDLGPGRGRARRPRSSREGPPAKVQRIPQSLTGQFLARQAADRRCRQSGASRKGGDRGRWAPRSTT